MSKQSEEDCSAGNGKKGKDSPLVLMGKKLGMMERFDEGGNVVPCTILSIQPNVVVQVKGFDRDGYCAVQVGCGEVKEKKLNSSQRGYFKSQSIELCHHLFEFRLNRELECSLFQKGESLSVDLLKDFSRVDVRARSKGKGFQGGMKLHGFKGGPASHGASKFHRKIGSTGMCSFPGRCLPGGKRPSQMGNRFFTAQSLEVVGISPEKGILLVKGAVPGSNGSHVWVQPAKKGRVWPKRAVSGEISRRVRVKGVSK